MGSIYKITNTVNGKSYIGRTIHDAEKTRIRQHLNGKGNEEVKKDIEKYGKDAFTYEILHDGIIPEFLGMLEKEAVAKFNTVDPHGYNLTIGGGSCSETIRLKLSKAQRGKILSEEHRRKMSEATKGEKHHQYGKPLSEETKRKLSEANKGENNPMSGKTHSEESRQKMSEWQKGKKRGPLSAETRRKISKAHKGKSRSKEHCENLSRALKGKPSWHKGKKRSKETCERIGRASKGRTSPNKGKPRTQKERENISRAVRHALKDKPNPKKGKPLSKETRDKISRTKRNNPPSKETREKMGRANRGKTLSKEIREKMSKAKLGKTCSSDKEPARKFLFSLPAEMELSEKRRCIYTEFPQRGKSTLRKWVRQWEDEKI